MSSVIRGVFVIELHDGLQTHRSKSPLRKAQDLRTRSLWLQLRLGATKFDNSTVDRALLTCHHPIESRHRQQQEDAGKKHCTPAPTLSLIVHMQSPCLMFTRPSLCGCPRNIGLSVLAFRGVHIQHAQFYVTGCKIPQPLVFIFFISRLILYPAQNGNPSSPPRTPGTWLTPSVSSPARVRAGVSTSLRRGQTKLASGGGDGDLHYDC